MIDDEDKKKKPPSKLQRWETRLEDLLKIKKPNDYHKHQIRSAKIRIKDIKQEASDRTTRSIENIGTEQSKALSNIPRLERIIDNMPKTAMNRGQYVNMLKGAKARQIESLENAQQIWNKHPERRSEISKSLGIDTPYVKSQEDHNIESERVLEKFITDRDTLATQADTGSTSSDNNIDTRSTSETTPTDLEKTKLTDLETLTKQYKSKPSLIQRKLIEGGWKPEELAQKTIDHRDWRKSHGRTGGLKSVDTGGDLTEQIDKDMKVSLGSNPNLYTGSAAFDPKAKLPKGIKIPEKLGGFGADIYKAQPGAKDPVFNTEGPDLSNIISGKGTNTLKSMGGKLNAIANIVSALSTPTGGQVQTSNRSPSFKGGRMGGITGSNVNDLDQWWMNA